VPPYYDQPEEDDPRRMYESAIRGGPTDPRQLSLMRLMSSSPFYGPSQGIAGPVPRRTGATLQGPPPTAPAAPPPQDPYFAAMQGPAAPPQRPMQGPEEYGPPDQGSAQPEGDYRRIVNEYLQSLQQPYHLPEPAPFSRREKLGLLAAREPWQREMIVSAHREPYERAMAEAQIGERRRGSAAGLAADLEKAQQYEKYRLSREGRPSQELDYVDKVEKAHADKGNTDYPYSKPQWKALADFNAKTSGRKMAATKEAAIADIDREIRAEEDQIFQSQARTDLMGNPLPGNPEIGRDAGERKRRLVSRRNLITGMTPDIYQKFLNLSADQQDEVTSAYEKRAAAAEAQRLQGQQWQEQEQRRRVLANP
jgi:hypothetical protein